MNFLLSRILQKYTTVFKGLTSYKNSSAQNHLHSIIRNERQFKALKGTIDYATIKKNSKGKFMFRQFLFQEKVEQNYVAPLNCCFLPAGKWSSEDKDFQNLQETLTKTETINKEIMDTCGPALEAVFRQYYQRIGKPRYRFILSEEIGKIGKMSNEEFNKVIVTLGGTPQVDTKKDSKRRYDK